MFVINEFKLIILKKEKASKLLILLAFLMEYYIISKYNRELQLSNKSITNWCDYIISKYNRELQQLKIWV